MEIDVTLLVLGAGLTFAAFIAALLIKVLQKLLQKYGLDIDERHRSAIEQGFRRAVLAAVQAHGPFVARTDTAWLATALAYAVRSVPGALKHFGINPSSEAGHARVQEMILSRVPEVTGGPRGDA